MNEGTQNGEGASTRNDTLGRASEKDAAGHARCAEEPQRIASGRTLPDGSVAYDAREAHPFIALAAPVVAIIVEGQRVVEGMRVLMGSTDPTTAPAGTIRGDLGRAWNSPHMENLIHGSDSVDNATREISLWFPEIY